MPCSRVNFVDIAVKSTPKQVIASRQAWTVRISTPKARRILSRLGFSVGRRESNSAAPSTHQLGVGQAAEAMRGFRGQRVALKGAEVLVAADAPQKVIGWLEEHNVWADAMLRIPEDNSEPLRGGAPG